MRPYVGRAGCGRLARLLIALIGFCATAVAASSLQANGGHDHAAATVATVANVASRVEAASETFELVGIVRGDAMIVFLDRFADNAPVIQATIDVTGDGSTVRAELLPDGSFLLRPPWLERTGRIDLVFAIAAGEDSDLLIGTLELPGDDAESEAAEASTMAGFAGSPLAWAMGAVLLLVGVAIGRSLAPRGTGHRRQSPAAMSSPAALGGEPASRRERGAGRRRHVGAAIVLAFLGAGASLGAAQAHGDEDHGAAGGGPAAVSPSAGAADSPRRLADGSLFVPKPTQRLLAVRTEPAHVQTASRTNSISGRVIPDPSAGGRVQAAQGGRVEPTEGGLPVVGQQVAKGQPLATVEPVITTLERGGLREQLAQIDSDVAIAEQRVARLSQLRGSVPQREIDEARRELEGLQQRRRALAPALAEREVVRASASGVISVANVVTGQLIDGGEILFEIVDPTKLWVEAVAYDPATVVDIREAVATTADGETLPLDLVGRSLTLRQQAVPVLFRVARQSGTLKVGTPVTVILQSAATGTGIVLPTASVVGTANGEHVVFEHVSAERFLVRPVRVHPLDGERLFVVAGIDESARIVTQGAELLSQIR